MSLCPTCYWRGSGIVNRKRTEFCIATNRDNPDVKKCKEYRKDAK
jgi:hypothetical protein